MDGKKYFELTPTDLQSHPIWVLSMDVATFSDTADEDWDDDTGLVVPLPSDPEIVTRLFENCICYARVSFVAANGSRFTGIVRCWSGDRIEGTHPAIVTDGGQVSFYSGIAKPTANEISASYACLGIASGGLFPLAYRPDVSLPDGLPEGELLGFYYMELRGRDQEIKYVQ